MTYRYMMYWKGSALICILLTVGMAQVSADVPNDRKRALMQTVKKVVVLPPFLGTDTLAKADALRKSMPNADPGKQNSAASDGSQTSTPATLPDASRDKNSDKNRGKKGTRNAAASKDARLLDYADKLQKLQESARTLYPERVAARSPFMVVPADELNAALKDLGFTPETLYQNKGKMRGDRYPQPDADAVRKLAARIHAQAVLLTMLDEPRSSEGHYNFDLLSGLDYQYPRVACRAGFDLLMADGTEVLHQSVEVLHPRTRSAKREFLLADWLEAQSLAIEDFMDEWNRYTPAKRIGSRR